MVKNPAAVPAVTTAAVPTTDEMATTSDAPDTTTPARPWIHVVAVVEPAMVFVSMASDPAVAPV